MPAMLAMLAMPLAAAMLGTLSSKWTTQSYHIRGPFIPNTAIPYNTVPYKGSLRHSLMTKSHPSYTPSLLWKKHLPQKAIDTYLYVYEKVYFFRINSLKKCQKKTVLKPFLVNNLFPWKGGITCRDPDFCKTKACICHACNLGLNNSLGCRTGSDGTSHPIPIKGLYPGELLEEPNKCNTLISVSKSYDLRLLIIIAL